MLPWVGRGMVAGRRPKKGRDTGTAANPGFQRRILRGLKELKGSARAA